MRLFVKKVCIYFILLNVLSTAVGHEQPAKATYLGNEGVMIRHAGSTVLFDPFFHNSYNNYQLVPETIRDALFSGKKPYDEIDAIFISHAHGDHYAADDLMRFLLAYPDTQLVAPDQAIKMLVELPNYKKIESQLHSISLQYKDAPIGGRVGNISYDVVRIPHAGWPQRSGVSNLVFRVSLDDAVHVMHMGDADPDQAHFAPLKLHWQKQITDTAFPPYWFLTSEQGQVILTEHINSKQVIGVHVPVKVPQSLKSTEYDYFIKPGNSRPIVHN